MGDSLQERQVALGAVQETSSQVEDRAETTEKANAEQQAAFKKLRDPHQAAEAEAGRGLG